MKNITVRKITTAAVLLAALIVFQYFSKALGQYVTGSLVNFVLIAAVVLGGVAVGCVVAVLSPALAFLVGIGPAFPQVVPVIALGNLAIVLVCAWVLGRSPGTVRWAVAVVAGAVVKFLVLYVGMLRIALPLLLNAGALKAQQAAVLSASFSWPQLVTALLGGVLAFLIVPPVRRAMAASL